MSNHSRPRVAIESPYSGDVEANERFAETICRWAWNRGYNPLAAHLHHTRFLDDLNPQERQEGIEAGIDWTSLADEIWFCLRHDEPLTPGMKRAAVRAGGTGKVVRYLRFTEDGIPLPGRVYPRLSFHVGPGLPAEVE